MKQIRAIVLDFDGVLTDGTFTWGPDGQEFKRFAFTDSTGIAIARDQGMRFAIISGASSPLVERYATKLQISDFESGCHDKAASLRAFADKYTIGLAEICFMGDDVIDLPALRIAGFSVAPDNAHSSVREVVDLVTTRKGGDGAVRELIDAILAEKLGPDFAYPSV